MAKSLGGTGDPPVLGGNLPPSFGTNVLERIDGRMAHAERRAGGTPQRPGGPFPQTPAAL